jgi:segregation and condensation protein B
MEKEAGGACPMKDHTVAEAISMDEKIARIEAVLFVSQEPVEAERFMDALGCRDVEEFERLIDRVNDHYHNTSRGLILKRSGGGFQLATKPDLHVFLKDFFTRKVYSRLTVASLETLAIVAYRQPVTIAEISELRGVNSIGPVKNLLQKKLIKMTGRKKVPGLPGLYSTTREFLLYFGLDDLTELPTLEELTEMFEEKEQPSLFK